MKTLPTVCLSLALLAAAACARAGDAPALKAGGFDPPRMAPDFTLPGTDGAPLKLSAYRGKVVLLGFGYTHCTNVCPITLATLKQAKAKLGAQARDLQVVYVTVDPGRDTAAVLKSYLGAFDAGFLGATGSATQLAAVRKAYGVSASEVMMAPMGKMATTGSMATMGKRGRTGSDGSMSHSSFVYLIDRQGRIRALMPFGHGADDYVHDVRILLASP